MCDVAQVTSTVLRGHVSVAVDHLALMLDSETQQIKESASTTLGIMVRSRSASTRLLPPPPAFSHLLSPAPTFSQVRSRPGMEGRTGRVRREQSLRVNELAN